MLLILIGREGEEEVLVQGVIDCLFEDEQGLVLVDYKTDAITGRFQNGFEGAKPILADRYRTQLQLYTRAVEGILNKTVTHRYLFFFDGAHLIRNVMIGKECTKTLGLANPKRFCIGKEVILM